MYNLHPNNQVLVRNATSCYSSSSLCSMFSLLFSSRSKYLAETNSVVRAGAGMAPIAGDDDIDTNDCHQPGPCWLSPSLLAPMYKN